MIENKEIIYTQHKPATISHNAQKNNKIKRKFLAYEAK